MRGPIALLATAGFLLAAGCGGDDETKPRPPKSAKQFHERSAKFHRQGTAICHRAARDGAALARAILRGEGEAAMPRFLEAEERSIERFAALQPPSRKAARLHRKAVAVHRAGHRISESIYVRVQQGMSLLAAVAAERSRSRRLGRRSDFLHKRLGLPDCTRKEFQVLVRGNI